MEWTSGLTDDSRARYCEWGASGVVPMHAHFPCVVFHIVIASVLFQVLTGVRGAHLILPSVLSLVHASMWASKVLRLRGNALLCNSPSSHEGVMAVVLEWVFLEVLTLNDKCYYSKWLSAGDSFAEVVFLYTEPVEVENRWIYHTRCPTKEPWLRNLLLLLLNVHGPLWQSS